mmetsp:Transcript_15930/g.24819  ORF Transcript_15930/g.24819 Transcript_15930/m.24819 type:complete len:317 (-) Transcript_15930:111-1061(-)
MSTYGAETAPEESQAAQRAALAKALTVDRFLRTYASGPWILVENGSIMGYFDWVPEKLRVGKWHPLSAVSLVGLFLLIVNNMPESFQSDIEKVEMLFAPAFSLKWYMSVVGFVWTSILLRLVMDKVGPIVLATYTMQSWTMNLVRFALLSIAPFVVTTDSSNAQDVLSRIVSFGLKFLRFPALETATTTFLIWNLILMPLVSLVFMETAEKRKRFLVWCFSFRMVNIHLLNLPIAIFCAILSSPIMTSFTAVDLWYALAVKYAYLLFYLLVLDRLGVHLYPIASPRSIYSLFMWGVGYSLCYGTFIAYNRFIDRMS